MTYTVIYATWVSNDPQPSYETVGVSNPIKTYIPLNAVLASKIPDSSDVRVILIDTVQGNGNTDERIKLCKDETLKALEGKNCNIEFVRESNPFQATKDNIGKLYLNLLSDVRPDSTIFADITFGPKYVPLIVFCLLSYAERFLGCDIDTVMYGQVFFDEDKKPKKPVLQDLTSIYLLSSLSRIFGNSKDDYDRFLKGFLGTEEA